MEPSTDASGGKPTSSVSKPADLLRACETIVVPKRRRPHPHPHSDEFTDIANLA